MSKKIVIILAVVCLLIVGMMGAGFFVIWSKVSNMNAATAAVAPPGAGEADAEPMGVMHQLDTFIVNLAEKGGNRYLRVTMELELDKEELKAEIDQRLPQVRDAMLMILPSKKIADIATTDGKTALREEIIERLNELFETGQVTNLYYTEFVIQ